MHNQITPIHEHKKYWAECFGTAPFLPTSRKEMDALGWDSCDIIIVTGDAMLTIQALVWLSSADCSKRRAFASASLLSQDGTIKTTLCLLVSLTSSLALLRVTWTP